MAGLTLTSCIRELSGASVSSSSSVLDTFDRWALHLREQQKGTEASYLAHGQEIAMLVYMGHDLLVKHGGDLKQLLNGISVSSVKLFRIELYSGLTHHHL